MYRYGIGFIFSFGAKETGRRKSLLRDRPHKKQGDFYWFFRFLFYFPHYRFTVNRSPVINYDASKTRKSRFFPVLIVCRRAPMIIIVIQFFTITCERRRCGRTRGVYIIIVGKAGKKKTPGLW